MKKRNKTINDFWLLSIILGLLFVGIQDFWNPLMINISTYYAQNIAGDERLNTAPQVKTLSDSSQSSEVNSRNIKTLKMVAPIQKNKKHT